MKNDFRLESVLLLVLLMLVVQGATAQSASGEAGVLTSSQRYTRVSGDTLRVRRGSAFVSPRNRADSAVVPTSVPARRSRRRTVQSAVVERTDSVAYQAVRYALGDRIIMRGDTGPDVRKLAEILVKNLYVDERLLQYSPSGEVVYEGELVEGVMRFQRVNDMYPDGIVWRELAQLLKKL